ncbi:dTDP-4-dehydrorhamnose reductase [Phreatobacter stygius]|uniref:dTDP-4-dehydrorhamnose reductase n=1 Tax=Phreatobacter stygius TaxID=1940610 RepID=A0A4D7B4Z1_9HYPH|nr:dTDP-4-dehydrorhamnose reductase [Phreatobacter stygius]QCI66245.1 dTDP-4-dehydrorhamnose reductase [Phreatobacter stygius]
MRIVVIGREGQVARSLTERAPAHAGIEIVTLGRPDLDLTRSDDLAGLFERRAPDLVINPAAYTAVDDAETNAGLAFAVNRDGAAAVAAAAARLDLPVLHLSTDYVFDGTSQRPYREGDPVNPVNVYGRSKLAGERAVARVNARHLIIRTSWLYSTFGSNFAKSMLRLGAEQPALRVVDDQWGMPSYGSDVADALLTIAARLGREGWQDAFAGVCHLAASPAMSWCGFAREIFAVSARHGGPSVPVSAISTSDYPRPARRPLNSRLDCGKVAELFGISLPHVPDAVARCVPRILAGTPAGQTIGAVN